MKNRKRYAIVGIGGRHEMYRRAITDTYAETCQLVALCDLNEGRLQLALKTSDDDVKGYNSDAFEQMIEETRPDCVVVTTRDSFHDVYICCALELGCDVITEKPMTTDHQKCQRIIDTQRKTCGKVTVTFNYRYASPRSQVKELLMSGIIGEVLSMDFHWMLNSKHGADYYRRWHANKENSGGLMVHKATHHFDLVNWWLSSIPTRVYATGQRKFYTPQTAERYGLTNRSERCHDCPEAEKCPFELRMSENEKMKALYLDNEHHDGYFRDQCVFSERIDIEDNMNVIVDYDNDVKLSYSLNSFCPWEGYIISFNGTRGRIEHKCEEAVTTNDDGSIPGALKEEGNWTRIYPMREPAYEVETRNAEGGGHGGADPVMLSYIFDPENQPEDPLMRAADHRAGAYSILTGIAANVSLATGTPVDISSLVKNIGRPDYPPMPASDAPLQLIPKN